MNKKIGIASGLLLIVFIVLGWDVYQHHQAAKTSVVVTKTPVSQTKSTAKPTRKSGKVLIVYFSRKGQNYGGTNLKIGNTHQIANFIAARTEGDQYEIVPAKPYPESYDATADQAQKEQNNNSRPQIKNALPNVSKYHTIFLGYPIWWNEPPMIVLSFLDRVNLQGKQVVPFVTHGGSGFGDSLSILKKESPHVQFLKGFEVEGTQAAHAQKQVNTWLQSLGY
ncbi:flavodoxin [Bombilactobacillus mellis]|uniref:flavodoxin n=1 Tax=Bombilactobacillus mellis TaxID=1218508 RepID=UPI002247F81D|nr:flavodoxin [Bombilactobacillus mellis]MCX0279243.1 flavodoxin [Bombilactobacillus mellis]